MEHHTLHCPCVCYKWCILVAIAQYLKGLNLMKKVLFPLYLGFHQRDFPETLYLTLSMHVLQMMFGFDWSILKGTSQS